MEWAVLAVMATTYNSHTCSYLAIPEWIISFYQDGSLLLQFATKLKKKLDESNLQLIREFTFNTEDSVNETVQSLKVSEYNINTSSQSCNIIRNESIIYYMYFSDF